MAFGGACRLCLRRCISPPVITSMPAISCSRIDALSRAELRVRKIAFPELAQCDQPIKRLIPSRYAVRPDHCRSVPWILWHFVDYRSAVAAATSIRSLSPLGERQRKEIMTTRLKDEDRNAAHRKRFRASF